MTSKASAVRAAANAPPELGGMRGLVGARFGRRKGRPGTVGPADRPTHRTLASKKLRAGRATVRDSEGPPTRVLERTS